MDLLNLFVKIGVKDEASAAVDDVSGNIIGKLASAAKTAAKALAGMWAVKKVADFGKAAYDSYANFQQLVGGIDKLYGEASGKMQQYAQQAWRTAGMDANAYMQSVTGFSASLITSLGGDTQKAADIANTAMQDISDNANMFGKYTAEELTGVYQALAKGQYQTLDNLQLGYGGSKEGMQQLIDKANELRVANGEMGNLSMDSFADIVQAIHLVQEEMNITGTTEKEALKTLEGSANATKAAWQNLVTEFGKPDADIGARVSDLVDGIFGIVDEKTGKREGGLFKNVTAEVSTIATNMVNAVGQGVQAGFDWLTQNGPQMVSNAMSAVAKAVNDAYKGLFDFIYNGGALDIFEALFGNGEEQGIGEKVASFMSGIGESIAGWAPQIAKRLGDVAGLVADGIALWGPKVLGKIGEILGNIGNAILEHGPELVGASVEMFGTLAENITSKGPELVQKVISIAETIVFTARDWLVANGPSIIEAIRQTLSNVLAAIAEHGPQILANIGETIGTVIGYVIDAAPKLLAAAIEFMGGLITGTSDEGKKLHEWFANFFPDGLLKGLGDFGKLLLDAGKALIQGLLDGIGKVAPDVEKAIKGAFDSVVGFFQGIASFIADPIGSIEDFVASLTGTSDEAVASVDSAMDDVGASTAGAAAQIAEYNATELENKSASADISGNAQDGKAKADIENTNKSVKSMSGKNVKATVSGNAQDGKAKTSVENTSKAVKNLSGKSISVSASGNIISGVAESAIKGVKSLISNLHDKSITLTTHKKEVKDGGAWGGIKPRYHATGGVRVADRWGEGVPLDVVGERGPEAIVPLTSRYGKDFAQMMGREAGKYLSGHTSGGNSYNLYYSGEQSALDMFDDLTFRMQVLEAMGD